METQELEIVKELKTWLQGYVNYTEKKIENMKRVVPDHRNILRFEGEIHMAKKITKKIEELEKTNSQRL